MYPFYTLRPYWFLHDKVYVIRCCKWFHWTNVKNAINIGFKIQ